MGSNKIGNYKTRTGVHSNIGSIRTGPQDPDGEEIIDTGLDDMMIDSNINIGIVFKSFYFHGLSVRRALI